MPFVTIIYADGIRENANMMNMVVMVGPSGWRMVIGKEINPDSSGPPSAAAGPSS